jgi:hypothetical protein
MRTKIALLSAALVAAGVASSMAQSNVYSLNIVGYVNVPVTANNFYLLSNPFDTGNGNSVSNVMSSLLSDSFNQDGSSLYTFDPVAGYSSEGFNYGGSAGTGYWYPGTTTLAPGKGFWFQPQDNQTITFTGSVVLNSTNTLAGNGNVELSLVGSAYPASTNLVGLGMNWLANNNGFNQDGDGIYRWNPATQSFMTEYSFNYGNGWSGPTGDVNGPVLNVAEGFFYVNANGTDQWVQNFTVN